MSKVSGGNRPSRSAPRPIDAFDELPIRVPTSMCVSCRKTVERGDQLVQVFQCLGVGIDPETLQQTAAASGNFHVAHVNCADPQLRGTVITVGR